MAEFHFYVAADDRIPIIEDILSTDGYAVIPDLNHPSESPHPFRSVSPELLDALDRNPRLFIVGPFSGKLSFNRIDDGAYAGTFVININRGGPALALSMPLGKLEGGVRMIPPANLFYPSRMWDLFGTHVMPPPEALKASYEMTKRQIKRHMCRVKLPPERWMGLSAAELYGTGRAKVLVDGKWRGRDESVASQS